MGRLARREVVASVFHGRSPSCRLPRPTSRGLLRPGVRPGAFPGARPPDPRHPRCRPTGSTACGAIEAGQAVRREDRFKVRLHDPPRRRLAMPHGDRAIIRESRPAAGIRSGRPAGRGMHKRFGAIRGTGDSGRTRKPAPSPRPGAFRRARQSAGGHRASAIRSASGSACAAR